MIAKKVPLRAGRSSSFSQLVKYIIGNQGKAERIGNVNVTNCQNQDIDWAIQETLAIQAQNVRTKADKTYHLLISFPPGEVPTLDVLRDIEARICNSLGYDEHQRVSAIHNDTDSLHVHVVINKIHPKKLTIHEPYRDYQTLGQICTALEVEYGLQHVNHTARKDGSQNRADDMEQISGIESLLGWIKRGCLPEIQQAQSWGELHQVLRENGLRIRQHGNGLVVSNQDGITIKASSISRELSKSKLEAKLGSFIALQALALSLAVKPPADKISATLPAFRTGRHRSIGQLDQIQINNGQQYKPYPMQSTVNTVELYAKYKREQDSFKDGRAREWEVAKQRKNRRLKDAKRIGRLKRAATKLLGENGPQKRLLYSLTSRALRVAIEKINAEYLRERQVIYQKYQRMAWANWLQRQAQVGDAEALEALRARNAHSTGKRNAVKGQGERFTSATPVLKLDTLTKRGTIIYRVGESAIRDDGAELKVSHGAQRDGLEVALRMAMGRYGSRITVNGSAEFKAQIAHVAAAANLFLTFDDPALERRRQALLRTTTYKEHAHERPDHGSFMAAWLYKGDDNASSTDQQREMVSFRINQALASMGSGWMVHVDAVRRSAVGYSKAGLSHFPDTITRAIDEERRRLFENLGTMYEGFFVCALTYCPPLLAQRKFVELMFDDDQAKPNQKARTKGLIEGFKRDILSFESRMSSAVKLFRLKGVKVDTEEGRQVTHDELLRWLQFCVTGLNHPVQLPSNPIYLDALIGGQDLVPGVVPKIGRKFIQVVAIDGFPLECSPGILTTLGELACKYRWSNRFIFMDQHEAVSHLEKFRKKWRQKVRGFFDQVFNTNTGSIDQDALSMVQDAEAAIAEVNSGIVAQGYYTSVVVLMDESRERVETEARKVAKAINQLGFSARIETINTMDAFMGSIPGHGVENVRRPLLNTMNLADLLPTSTIWTGLPYAPCPMYPAQSPALMQCVTHGATPFRLNLHVRDVGHTLIFGPTGNGKSVLLALIAAQLRRYRGMTLFCFDKGMSMYPLAKAAGGKHYNVAADDDTLAFCPLQYLETKGDRTWAMEWIDTILALNGYITTPVDRNEIAEAIFSMYENGARKLSEFYTTVQNEQMRQALEQYIGDGSMGHLLDADSDSLSLSDFSVFEIEELMELGEKFSLPVLLYLFCRIERALKGQPAAIILDEAWLMLGHSAFRAKIREWLKVLRKANCIVIMATQSLTDASNSGILDVIVESSATKIFLPNLYARDEDTAALYTRMGLNSRQIEILATAQPKRHYYYVSENGQRLFDLALGPLTLALVGSSDKESIATIKKLEATFGEEEWTREWLRIKNVNMVDYGVAA